MKSLTISTRCKGVAVGIVGKFSPGFNTPASQSPRGVILRGVNLPGVFDPGESLLTLGSQQPNLKMFEPAFKVQL